METLWSRCYAQPRTTFNLVTLRESWADPTQPYQLRENLSMFNPTGWMNTTGKRVSLAAGNWSSSSSYAEVGSSQVYRQEMVNLVARRLGQKDLTRPKSEEDSHSTGQFVAVSPEMENVPYVEKKFQCIQKKLGRTWINAAFSVGFLLEQRIGMDNLHDTVDEGSHPLWARFLENSEVCKNTKLENILKRSVLNVKPWMIIHLMNKICTVQRQRDQLGASKRKDCVHADSVQRVGKIEQNPGAADAKWTGQLEDLKRYPS